MKMKTVKYRDKKGERKGEIDKVQKKHHKEKLIGRWNNRGGKQSAGRGNCIRGKERGETNLEEKVRIGSTMREKRRKGCQGGEKSNQRGRGNVGEGKWRQNKHREREHKPKKERKE